MPPQLKPELKDDRLNIAIESSLMRLIDEYARSKGVKKAAAVRYIIASFLENDFQKSKEN